ncbi:hypothetical protein [Arthrobacter mobilis]|uniref:Uncharacterized protein n=1 Tax=Arthrobacter mobilis TaxID=2724944 RepID=A0A7X6K6U4_9MICC|nr:hypothetical protein [Arthrobacter mobilis]NKX56000.1 hypothetical protein [Arthrobacter mobilis]
MTSGSTYGPGPEWEPGSGQGSGKYFGAGGFNIPEWPVVKIFSGTEVVGINSELFAEKLNREIEKGALAEGMGRIDSRTAAAALDRYSWTHRVEDVIGADLSERAEAGPGKIRMVDDQTTEEIASALVEDPEFRQNIESILGYENDD